MAWAERAVEYDFHTGRDWCTPRWCAPRKAASGRGHPSVLVGEVPELAPLPSSSGSPNVRRWTIWRYLFVSRSATPAIDAP